MVGKQREEARSQELKLRRGDIDFTEEDVKIFRHFKKPYDIQRFLDRIAYDSVPGTSSPRVVLRERKANCFEGALFAAAALRMLGHKPLIVDMVAENDDDHVIAVFRQNGCYGAVAKSNTTVLRFREPVYRSVRELVMSYFDFYFNVLGEKSLWSYSDPVNLSKFDKLNWTMTDDDLESIGDYLCTVKHHDILSRKQLRNLNRAEDELVRLCFSGAVEKGVFKPSRRNAKKGS